MNAIQKRIHDLKQYTPPLTADTVELDRFWDETLANYENKPLCEKMDRVNSPLIGVEVYHVSYEGFDDTPIHGWYLVPSFLI